MFEAPQIIKQTKTNGFLISTVDLKGVTIGKPFETMVFLDDDSFHDVFCSRSNCKEQAKRTHEIQTLVFKLFHKN